MTTLAVLRLNRLGAQQPAPTIGSPPATMQDVRRLERWLVRILGLLLIVLGLTLFLAPRIAYTTHERIAKTPYRVRRDHAILVPRPVAGLIAASGILVLYLA